MGGTQARWGGVKPRAGTAGQAPGGRSVKETFEFCARETYCERCGVRVEDIEAEFLQSLLKHDVHHGVVFTILCVQITDLHKANKMSHIFTSMFFYSLQILEESSKLKAALCLFVS